MISIATVGTGDITAWFLKAAALTGRFSHRAVFSRSGETGRAFAEKVGCDRVETTLDAIGDDPSIDAVYIASPNVCHGWQSRFFLEHGKHVLCEKPIATSAEEYHELKALADRKGLVYMEAITSRFCQTRRLAMDALPKLGRIAMARLDYCQRSSKYDRYRSGENPNIFNMSLHAGTLMDLGIYCVWSAVDLFGEPERITADASLLENGADGSGIALFDYGTFPAVLTYSKTGQSALGSEIIGDKGTLKIGLVSQFAEIRLIEGGKETVLCGTADRPALMSGEAAFFAAAAAGEEPALMEYEQVSRQTLTVHQCMDRIKTSAGLKYE